MLAYIDSIFESRGPICTVLETPNGNDSITCTMYFSLISKKIRKTKEKLVIIHAHAWPPSSLLEFGQYWKKKNIIK